MRLTRSQKICVYHMWSIDIVYVCGVSVCTELTEQVHKAHLHSVQIFENIPFVVLKLYLMRCDVYVL